ncbi:hypothetical protein [Nannocystis exedens]|uniref:hypothetical protein n=1 Tax=Nannocystis exedens TaxID=54 RepID=UPI0011606065|nr:hypothetical protein [Nannocystis exedens]
MPLLLALIGGCREDDPSDGSDTDAGTSSGEEPLSLPAVGVLGDWCPSNQPSTTLSVNIGVERTCEETIGEGPVVKYDVAGHSIDMLKAGQSWSSEQDSLEVWWVPGSIGGDILAVSGSLEVLSVSESQAVFRYEFVRDDGQPYAGEATVLICRPDPPGCS